MSSMRSLNASSLVSPSGFVEKLPDDQWIIEVRRWVSLQWAAYQTAISDYAIGPKVRDASTESLYDFPPPTEGGRKLCGMQKMRKGGGFMCVLYTNFDSCQTPILTFTGTSTSLHCHS